MTELDEDSKKVLQHINECITNLEPIDYHTINNYIPLINKIDQQYSDEFIPLITQLLSNNEAYMKVDPDGLLVQLLYKILSCLPFGIITNYFPIDYIIDNLFKDEEKGDSSIGLKIININIEQLETKQFLIDNNIIYRLLNEKYFNRSTSISVLNQIESLITSIQDHYSLLSQEYLQLYHRIRTQQDDTIILSRYLDYLILILPSILNNPIESGYYQFNRSQILKYQDDPLFLILLVQFYENIINKDPQHHLDILPSLNDLIELYMTDKLDDLVKLEIIDLVMKISYSNHPPYLNLLDHYQLFKTYNLVKIHEHNELDIKLLSRTNPNIINSLNDSIYDDILVNISLFHDILFFPILLNFIKSPITFMKLSHYFQHEKLQQLPLDKLYTLLLIMSKHPHTKSYLFNYLPNTLTSLLEANIRNNELWNLKLLILEQLLATSDDEHVEGYEFWKKEIRNVHDLMKFGKRFDRIIPSVDVTDEAAS
ncbi:HSM3 [[Candida] subhashii]|uniref:HSM3 n=1 Tax=[Candida] subhashii TaxID=561895 RepID=A0A8J5QDY9_9ASCO|nr:HSM3 [[Candida] subhashii]KAG7660639.1 HSM3 [[Candida] subhashii]